MVIHVKSFTQEMNVHVNIAFFHQVLDFSPQNTTGNYTRFFYARHFTLLFGINRQEI
jgi:hypothetical protein